MSREFAELCTISNFSFLQGASHPEELIYRASKEGYHALGIADYHSLAGIVRGHVAAKDIDMQFIPAARIVLQHEVSFHLETILYPKNKRGYGTLCALLSKGNLRSQKGSCAITLHDLLAFDDDITHLFCVTIIPPLPSPQKISRDTLQENFWRMTETFLDIWRERSDISLALTIPYAPTERLHVEFVLATSARFKIAPLATNDALYHEPRRRALHDVLTCIREGTSVQHAGFVLEQNAERYLKPIAEVFRRYRFLPEAVTRSLDIASRLHFSLDELVYQYPHEVCPPHRTPIEYLKDLTYRGAHERYGQTLPASIITTLTEELSLIEELRYEHYFLTCHDIVRFARERGILCQGRGAAANSAVCYCLGITSVDPTRIELLFARFVSKERNEPPDIDIDFEHERREEVIQYIYEKYGRHRAGLVSNVITYRHRSAVREVGKALGLSLETVDILAKLIHRWNRCEIPNEDLIEAGISPGDPLIRTCFLLTEELIGFPRHLSQHVGGFIISETPLSEIVPILNSGMESRTIIEWNKDDIELLGILKIDILALGMLTCIRKALEYINASRAHRDEPPLELHSVPPEDPAVYNMVCAADTIGVFQIESRAQMSMLPRLKPRCFYDLVIEVAIVRPGPIQGNMVHPYLKRRSGLEPVSFPDEQVKRVLGKTLGVPLFQEQAMRLAIVVAGFTPGEAEKLRRAMAAWKRNKEAIASFQERIISGMTAKGYSYEFAHTCVEQMKGFSEYGFPESHAASFAFLVYVSAWIKCHYPAEFAAALLNSQPMGFYAPSQIVQDAKRHGVTVLPICIKESLWDSSVSSWAQERTLRLGLRLVRGVGEAQANAIVQTRKIFPTIKTLSELFALSHLLEAPIRRETLLHMARADACHAFCRSMRDALWEIRALPSRAAPLDRHLSRISLQEDVVSLKPLTLQQSLFADYAATGLSLKAHPIGIHRKELAQRGVVSSQDLQRITPRTTVLVGGLIICRQRPHTARGVVFLSLEDETGIANIVIRRPTYDAYRRLVTNSIAVLVRGTLERTGSVCHVIASQIEHIDAVPRVQDRSYSY